MSQFSLLCLLSCILFVESSSHNLSCYQCVRYDMQECAPSELVHCPSNFDRCVTHYERDERKGLMVKRECGLGPCTFEDDMVKRGLGLNPCDLSKEEFFCVTCCKASGCNKNSASIRKNTMHLLVATIVFILPFSYP